MGISQTLVLLHGWSGSEARWSHNVETLAKEFRVYTPNLHQLSSSNSTFSYSTVEQSLESGRRLFVAFLEAEGLEKVSLVGQSMGGIVALDLALNYPNRVEKLALVDSAGLGLEVNWGLRMITLPLLGEVICDFVWPWLYNFISGRFHISSGVKSGSGNLARLLRMGIGLRGQKLWHTTAEQLPTLKVPTLIMWGEKDPIFPVSQAYAAHRAIPGSRLHVFPGSGHNPAIARPEDFNEYLIEFMKGSAVSSGEVD